MDSTSINALSNPRVEDLALAAPGLRLKTWRLDGGTRIIDAGIDCRGGLEGIR